MCVCRIRIASSLLLFSTNYTNFVFRSHSRLWNADLAVRIAIAISAITNEQQKNTHTGYRGAMQKILSFVVWHLIFVVRNKEKSNLWFYWSMRFIFCHYRHLSCMVVWIGCPLIEIDVACLEFYIFWGFLFLNFFLLSQQHLMNLLLCRVYIRPATSTSWLHLFCRRQIVGFIKFLWWFLCFHFFGSYTHKHKLQFDGKLPGRLSESVR